MVAVWAVVGVALAAGNGTSNAAVVQGVPQVTAPVNGATVRGTVTLASDGGSTSSFVPSAVRFVVDGTSVGLASWTGAAYVLAWNSATVADGAHSLGVQVRTRKIGRAHV